MDLLSRLKRMRAQKFLPVFFSWFFLLSSHCFAATVSGKITDSKGEVIPFASVYIKGTTSGATTNINGIFSIVLQPGSYELVFKSIGYKTYSEKIVVEEKDIFLPIRLEDEVVTLNAVTIKAADQEDPAYAIIREAIKKRKFYLEQVKSFSCDAYVKGIQRLLKHPKKVMGIEIDPENEIDTSSGVYYLSESVSKFYFRQPDKVKEEMVSSKVSGKSSAFSWNSAAEMHFNFYENLIQNGLNTRGFISPIASYALLYYNYKLEGAFVENGELVNKIKVIPKRKDEPAFSGYIYITDGSWRIHSSDLFLTKDSQIRFLDTLEMRQNYIPVTKEVWMPFYSEFYFSFNIFGVKGNGTYLGINSNYVLDPLFPEKFFTGEQIKINPDANKKDTSYWSTTRPVPLTTEEKKDYRKKDSVAVIKESKPYLDSLDRKSNRVSFGGLVLAGYTHRNRFKKQSLDVSGLFQNIQFNTVQGWNAGLEIGWQKKFEHNTDYSVSIAPRYGFSNERWTCTGLFDRNYDPKHFSELIVQGGVDAVQFNSRKPISPLINTAYSLLNGQNFMKLYEKKFAYAEHLCEIVNGVVLNAGIEYAERSPLNNTTSYTTIRPPAHEYTSNNPLLPATDSILSFPSNRSLSINVRMRFRLHQKYYSRPDEKINIGSKYPSLFISYRKGISGLLGSEVDYDLVKAAVEGRLRLGIFGRSRWMISAGKFLNDRKLFFMDYYHFSGNQTLYSKFDFQSYELLDYYRYSTHGQFVEAHLEHNFGGFLFNRIPLLKKLNFSEIAGFHFISSDTLSSYTEVFFGLSKLDLFRAEFVMAFDPNGVFSSGFRFGFRIN